MHPVDQHRTDCDLTPQPTIKIIVYFQMLERILLVGGNKPRRPSIFFLSEDGNLQRPSPG
ncbi:hypothetical protein A6U86_19605 [Rhizobium sp. AC27/96]|nr:hypothetical protein A6U86_19605 [Rhizobium sp. AC27/96]